MTRPEPRETTDGCAQHGRPDCDECYLIATGGRAWPETRFTVIVTRLPRGSYEVSVKCQDGSDYATTRHAHLDVALNMAVPYMAYAAEPDPFAALVDPAR